MKVAIGSDHAGVELKQLLVASLKTLGAEVVDMGPGDTASVDYPDFAGKVSRAVTGREVDRGVLICGTGIGMSITANKFPGVRAALCSEPFSARMSRLHNDANILVIGGRVVGSAMADEILKVWYETPFEGDRHERRLNKIMMIEKGFGE